MESEPRGGFVNKQRWLPCAPHFKEASLYVFPLGHPPVSFVSTEGEGEVGRYFLKFPQRDVAILIVVVIFHDGLQGATERERRSEKKGPLQPVKERGVLVLLWPVDREGSERGVFVVAQSH